LIKDLIRIQKNEDNLKNIISLCEETSKYKKHFLFNVYRFISQILSIKYCHPEHNDNEYEVIGNNALKSKNFMNEFIIDHKIFENTKIYQVFGKYYPKTYYSLGIGYIEYVNGIFKFITNNDCCFYDSGVLDQGKIYEYSFKLRKEIQLCYSGGIK
jgi:hypothetical protein